MFFITPRPWFLPSVKSGNDARHAYQTHAPNPPQKHPDHPARLSADEALERVQRSVDTRCDGGEGVAPETADQKAAVRSFKIA